MEAVLFDLDGTLLNLEIDDFFPRYLKIIEKKVRGSINAKKFIDHLLYATQAMINNTDPRMTNKEVFDQIFFSLDGLAKDKLYPIFDDFYKNDFPSLKENYGPVLGAKKVLNYAQKKGYSLILATNPLFPRIAIEERMHWAAITDFHFELITSYENMHACKPQKEYYQEILKKTGLLAEQCLMVGNDPLEDMVAGTIGIKTFLTTDYPIKRIDILFEPDMRGKLIDVIKFI